MSGRPPSGAPAASDATDDTICALATPPGEGAVGIVRLSGGNAREMVSRASRSWRPRPRRMQRVVICDPRDGRNLDQVLVCWMPGPGSYTGEDVVEIYGHGGVLNMSQLLELFVGLGARPAEPGEFTRRAFVNGRIDLIQAEAVADVIAARSERALRNARALLGGELGRRLAVLREQLIALAAALEACIDFAEDIEWPVAPDELARRHDRLLGELGQLCESYQVGKRLGGVEVALVGAVNAGKSSLFNALLGRRRALVSAERGTTRDYLEGELSCDGVSVTLVDTAGGRPEAQMSALERDGHQLGLERVARCDAMIAVVDASMEGSELAAAVVEALRSVRVGRERTAAVVVAANKVDLLDGRQRVRRLERLRRALDDGSEAPPPVVATSAVSPTGLDQLQRAVLSVTVGEGASAPPETVCVTRRRQWRALEQARIALREGCVALQNALGPELVVEHCREALSALDTITGQRYSEEVLDAVFARFCVGK